jgi:polysaccharide pyruvyl transferase CsaB
VNPSAPRILLSGYYGYGNLGDDALLEVILSELRQRIPHVMLDVLSAQPEETAHLLRVEATPRADLLAVKRAVERADLVISGGGGLLQNTTSLKSLLYYVGILRTAHLARKKTMIFAQSIGPLDLLGRKIVSEFCRGVSLATVRDTASRTLLTRLLPRTRVELTADPVFLYQPAEPPGEHFADTLGGGEPLALISVRKSSQTGLVAGRVAEAVDRLAERHGIRSVFLPFGGVADAEAAIAVIRRTKSKPLLLPAAEPARAAALIARCRVVIGMRLHALIFAARFCVPFLALSYDPKVSALVTDLGYPLPLLWSAEPSTTEPPAVPALVDRLCAEHDELSAGLRAAAERMRSAATRNFELLEGLLGT